MAEASAASLETVFRRVEALARLELPQPRLPRLAWSAARTGQAVSSIPSLSPCGSSFAEATRDGFLPDSCRCWVIFDDVCFLQDDIFGPGPQRP